MNLNSMPEPAVNNWENATLEDLREEVKNLRHFVSSLFLQIKEWTTRMNDLASTGEQIIQTKAERDAAYITLSNKTKELDESIDLIMDFLGMNGDETAPDDTPQPPYDNLEVHRYQ